MSLVSFQDIQYPTNSMADWSTSELGSHMLPWQPQQNIHSASFWPLLVACKNILCRMKDQCGVPSPHWGYSFRKSPTSIWHSIPQSNPILLSLLLGLPRSSALYPHIVMSTRSNNWRNNKDIPIYYNWKPSTTFFIESPTRYDFRIFCFTMSSF